MLFAFFLDELWSCRETLSQDPGWHRVPANHAVLIRADGTAGMRSLNVTTAQSVALVA
jgi:hypothetical protein